MKSRNLLLGIILLFVGVITLLTTLNVIDFNWRIAWHLWPMLFIFCGIAVLPIKDWMKAVALLVTLAVGVMLYQYEEKKEAERHSSGWVSSIKHWWDWLDEDVFDF